MVAPAERNVKGRCDKAGYLVDKKGVRIVDHQIKDRIRKRSYAAIQPDEFWRIAVDGTKTGGTYDKNGYFIVEHSQRRPDLTDKDGYLLQNGKRVLDEVIQDRLRVRR